MTDALKSSVSTKRGLFLVQQIIHEGFAFIFREMIPVQAALKARSTQLFLAKTQPFFPTRVGVLREGQQGGALSSGRQLPHNGNHMVII